MFPLGISLTLFAKINEFVLQGFPTTTTLIFLLALSLIYFPVSMKIYPLSLSRSPLSIPGPLGLAPTSKA
jgi:hypothetical protein